MRQDVYDVEGMPTIEVDVVAGRMVLSVYPEFLLRSTGMPVDLLQHLRSDQAKECIDEHISVALTVKQEQQEFLASFWPQALALARERYPHFDLQLKPLYKVNRKVRRCEALLDEDIDIWDAYGDPAWPVRWNNCLNAWQETEQKAREAYEGAKRAGRQALHDIFQAQRLQEAVFLSNPGFFERVCSRWLEHPLQDSPSKGTRQGEAIIHRYLRRFAAKCEATSFFGPTLFARFNAAQEGLLMGSPQPEHIFVEGSAWLVQDLARLLSTRQPTERLPIRRHPLFREQADGYLMRVLDGRLYRLDPALLQVWRLVDGQRTLAEIAAELHIPREQLSRLVLKLGSLLITQYEVPATEQRSLEYLARYDHENGPVQRMLAIRNQFAETAWPERRAYFVEAETLCRTLELEPRRGQGVHYADRTVFREDRSSPYNASLSIGRPALDNVLHTLASVFPLCFTAALLAREDARESLRAVLQGKTMPLIRLAQMQIAEKGGRAKHLQTALAELIQAQMNGEHIARIRSKELLGVLEPFLRDVPIEEPVIGCLPGPDLMAIGKDLQTAKWVLAELHDDSSSIFGGNPAALHPDPPGLWRRFQEQVVKIVDPSTMATVISRRRSKHITPELPGIRIELSGRASPSTYKTVAIADVLVEAQGRGVLVDDRLFHIYPGDLSSVLHRALALPCVAMFPLDFGDFTPRIEIDDVVYQRMRWRFHLPAGLKGFERWKLLHTLRITHNLPERVYVRHPDEPKPLFVDFADPAAIEDLGKLPAGPISVTEMLPGPGELWWQPGGQQQCSELRLGVLLRYETNSASPRSITEVQ